MKALLDYGLAAEFDLLADYVETCDPYELAVDFSKVILLMNSAIHPTHRKAVMDNLLKAETNEELQGMEDEQDS